MKRVIVASTENQLIIFDDYYDTNASYSKVKNAADCTTSEIYEEEMEYEQLGYSVLCWMVAREAYFEDLQSSNLAIVPIVSEEESNEVFPAQMVNGRVYDVTDEIMEIVNE